VRSYISKRALQTPHSGIRKIFNKTVGMKDIIHLEIGEPDFDTPEEIKNEACKALKEGYTHYTHNAGLIELRNAIAKYYNTKTKADLSPEQNIIVTIGGTGALFLSLLTVVDFGDEVLIPDPGYPPYTSMVKIVGGIPVYYPLRESNNFIPKVEDIENRISERTKAIIINTPHNPTGAVYPKEVLKSISEIAQEHDLILISDEVYENIVFDQNEHYSLLNIKNIEENTIVINSFSKTFAMTGWRLGFVISKNKEIIENMTKLQEGTTACAPSMLQKAAIIALESCQSFVTQMVQELKNRRDTIVKLLSEIENVSFISPQGTFYLFLNVSEYTTDSYSFVERLLTTKHVAVAPGRAFGENGEGYIRISFANSKENLIAGIGKLKEFLEEYKK